MIVDPQKNVFTTGEVAKLCNISQQTVIRCFDKSILQGFRVPGSRFRRIPRDSLFEFMKKNGMPLDVLRDGKKKVLVVDDDEAIVEMFEELLGRDGRFEVHSAATGYEAGIMTNEHKPDVMLLDFKLPDINGTEVCRTVRSNPAYENMRIICISGVADPDEIQELYDAGIDEFIRKPFEIHAVIDRMSEMLQLS